eukprot:10838113-Ditylum_brightwellii.AAC.1
MSSTNDWALNNSSSLSSSSCPTASQVRRSLKAISPDKLGKSAGDNLIGADDFADELAPGLIEFDPREYQILKQSNGVIILQFLDLNRIQTHKTVDSTSC